MRPSGTVLTFVAAVFMLGALLAPLVFWSVQAAAGFFPLLQPLADNPFPRFVSRTLMLVAIAGLWPLHRAVGIPPRGRLVPRLDRHWRTTLAVAFALGFLTLAVLVAGGLLAGQREWRPTIFDFKFLRAIVLSVTAAVVVAPLEEIAFRGVLFGSLRSPERWLGALLLSSVVFAAVHFLQTPKNFGPVSWWSGLEVLGAMFTGGAAENRLPQFLNLVLCGALLAWAYQRTGSLTFSIGLHAAWILWVKLANALTVTTASGEFWGTRKVIDGWAATACLLVLTAALPALTRKNIQPTTHVPNISSQAAAVG